MKKTIRVALATALGLALALPLANAAGGTPSARDVIVRGRTKLIEALRITTRAAWQSERPRQVALVVDVTRFTQPIEEWLVAELMALEASSEPAAGWRIAPLGGRFGAVVDRPTGLIPQLAGVLAEQTATHNSMHSLKRTLGGFRENGGVVVYLADWRFEDDDGLEGLVKSLTGASQQFSVIGTEAAFSRAWNDGFNARNPNFFETGEKYEPHIGRNPFGGSDEDAPWHGGDTAYPHLPAHWNGAQWWSEFSTSRPALEWKPRRRPPKAARKDGDDGLEDLSERLRSRRPVSTERFPFGKHPLPSSWGPYGLMRLCAKTGGRYVLWSWNPSGRSDVRYDYARCDHFPPDLRSRGVIRGEVTQRPLARALNRSWNRLADKHVAISKITSPLAKNHRGPREMKEVEDDTSLSLSWFDRAKWRDFLRAAPRALDELDGILGDLDRAIEQAGPSPADPDMRYLADAHLMRHIVLVQRFSLGEAYDLAQDVPEDAWKENGKIVTLRPLLYLDRARTADNVKPRTKDIRQPELGERVIADRKRELTRYAGTPFGETVGRNQVFTYRIDSARRIESGGSPPPRNPAESSDPKEPPETPTTPPGGGSGGASGPSTGR